MAKFGKQKITNAGIDAAVARIIEGNRSPGAALNSLDRDAKKVGATNAQRRATIRMVEKRFNSHIKQAKAGFDRVTADVKSGKANSLKKGLTPEKVAAVKESFSGAVASVMDNMMNPEPSQEGKPYGGSKELAKATRKAVRSGSEAKNYKKPQKKASGGKVYAQSRNMGGSIRKPRMK